MDETNNGRPALDKIVAALAKAKMSMGKLIASEVAKVQSEKANYSYRYADLAGVLEVIDKPLAANGLVFIQYPMVDYSKGAQVTVHGTLYHESGQFIETAPLMMLSSRPDPQGVGSAITYGRRYQAVAFFGLAQEDDDGEAAKQSQRQQTQVSHRQPQATNGNGHKPAPVAPEPTIVEAPAGEHDDLQRSPQIDDIVISFGGNPPTAWDWAANNQYTENKHSAQTRWREIVKHQFDGTYTPAKFSAIAEVYVSHYLNKAQVAA